MHFLKKYLSYFRSFSKNLTFITAGSLIIHFVVMIINIYASQTGSIHFDRDLFNIIFSGSMYPVVMAYGILIFITLTLYQKLREAEQKLAKERKEKEEYKNALKNMQKISGYVMQELATGNRDIMEWLQRKEAVGTAPTTVIHASEQIGKALQSLSYTFFVYPYAQGCISIPILQEQFKQIDREK